MSKENKSYQIDGEEYGGLHSRGKVPLADDKRLESNDWSAKNKKAEGLLDALAFTAPTAQKRTFKEIWREYPKSVMCIVGNEFCERFSYFGMRAILTLYLANVLHYDNNQATAIYSGFVMLCYFSPILGSILADGYIGKFYTILFVSLFYASGNVIIAVAASFSDDSVVHPWLDFIGLAVIGLGTGGIKPCVQTFGGDQFRKGQERELQQFFSIFYFAINAGSTISIFLTPILRTKSCNGQSTCYPLAFGIPAALMVVAVIFFAVGSYWYKKLPRQGNVFAKVGKIVGTALSNKRTFEINKEYWLDHALDSHTCASDEEYRDKGKCQKANFISDIKAVLRVIKVYLPIPVFFALYEQQGSTWIIQGTQMNSEISKGVYFLPDQMGVLNGILILILIPIFQIIIYPVVSKCFKVTPLRKQSIGGILIGVAYIACMFVQIAIRDTLPQRPASDQTLVTVMNYVQECESIQFIARDGPNIIGNATIKRNETHLFAFVLPNKQIIWNVEQGDANCLWVTKNRDHLVNPNVILTPHFAGYSIFTDFNTDLKLSKTPTEKSRAGESVFSININNYANQTKWITPPINGKVKIALWRDADDKRQPSQDATTYKAFDVDINSRTSSYKDIKPGTWGIFVADGSDNGKYVGQFTKHENGGIYTLTIFSDPANPEKDVKFEIARQSPDNTLSILWQVPQYFVLSVAEILFTITGNEFAYSQAPLTMKVVVTALWNLTDAIGNVIILIVATATTAEFDMAWIFLIYASLMFAAMAVFIFIAYRYKYVSYVRDD